MMTRLRVLEGARGVPIEVVVRQTELDELVDEVTALEAEAADIAAAALPLAQQLRLMAGAVGPRSVRIADELIALLERQERRHTPRRAA